MVNVLVVIPTFNESENIMRLLSRLENAIIGLRDKYRVDILIVDDNSPDKTADFVEAMQLSWVQLLRRPKKDGLGAAYRAGFLKVLGESKYSHVITMDADGSHRVEDLPALLTSMESSTSSKSLVIGTRWMPGGSVVNWPKYRQLLSKSGTRYAKFALSINLNDLTGGFRIYSADLLNSFNFNNMHATGYCFQIEMAMAADVAGAKATQVPITFVERSKGRSKMNSWIALEAFIFTSKNGIKRFISTYNRR